MNRLRCALDEWRAYGCCWQVHRDRIVYRVILLLFYSSESPVDERLRVTIVGQFFVDFLNFFLHYSVISDNSVGSRHQGVYYAAFYVEWMVRVKAQIPACVSVFCTRSDLSICLCG